MIRRHLPTVCLALALALAGGLGCEDDLPTSRTKLQNAEGELVRAGAARRLGELGGEEAQRVLLTYGLNDPAARVRAATIEALSNFDDRRVLDLFVNALTDREALVREAAAAALARSGTDKARRYVEVSYSRVGWPTRATLAEVIPAAGADPKRAVGDAADLALRRALDTLKDGNEAERVGAPAMLGRSGDERAIEQLLAALGARSVPLAAGAARALGVTGDARAAAPLAQVLSEPYQELQSAAAGSLAALGAEDVVPVLERVAGEGEAGANIDVLGALETFAQNGNAEARQALCRLALVVPHLDPVAGIARAVQTTGEGVPCELTAWITGALAGRDPAARVRALTLVQVFGTEVLDDAARQRLVRLYDDEDPLVVATALAAGAAAGDEAARTRALAELVALQDEDRIARDEWVRVLLPSRKDWGQPLPDQKDEDEVDPFDMLNLTGRGYEVQYGNLMEKVASYRAKQAVDEGEDVEAKTREHLEALTTDPMKARVEMVPETLPDAERRLVALLEALPAKADPDLLGRLASLSVHRHERVQDAAVGALVRLEGEDVDRLLASLLTRPLGLPALERIAQALSRRDGGEALLRGALADRRPIALGAILSALGRGKSPETVTLLAEALAGGQSAVAARSLGRVGTPEARDALVAYLEKQVDHPEPEAFVALSQLDPDTEAARHQLARGLHHPDPEVRAACGGALRRLGSDEIWLRALESDYDVRVRRAVTQGGTPAEKPQEG